MKRSVISAALLAALGREPEQTEAAPVTVEETPEPVVAEVTETPVVTETPAAEPVVQAENELVRYLKDELKTTKTELAASNEKLLKAEAQLNQVTEGVEQLEDIARGFCTHLAIAMGSQPFGLDKLNGSSLAAQYHNLRKSYEERFPVGGKAKTDAKPAVVVTATDTRFQGAVRATAFPTR